MKQIQLIKQLQSQLSKAEADLEISKIELANKQREHQVKFQSVKGLKDKIAALKKEETAKVSEHAIVRYFERVKGFNISDIEREILCDEIRKYMAVLGGNGSYPHPDGYQVKMSNHTVTTIVK